METLVEILGNRFKVIYCDLSKEDLCGDCDTNKRIIRISTHITPDEQVSTLFHECLHAALGIAGINNLLTEEVEEAIVCCIENAFNPHVNIPTKSK